MARKLTFRSLTPTVGTYRLLSEYDGPRPRPGMHVVLECTKCGDATRILPAYLWNAAAKGKQALSCPHCRQEAGITRQRKAGRTYTVNGVALTLPEWAERTGLNMRAMYARSKSRDKLAPELRQTDDYVVFGGSWDHPLRNLGVRPIRAIDKVLTMLEERVNEAIRASVSRIANHVVQDEIRPILLDMVRSGTLQAEEVSAGSVIPEGHVRAFDPDYRENSHDPNLHHPHDHELVGFNTTLLQYRQEVGDEVAISRWDYLEDLRMEDSDFSRDERETFLSQPLLREDLDRQKAEDDAENAKKKAEAEALRQAEEKEKSRQEREARERWTLFCLDRDVPLCSHQEGASWFIDERYRHPGSQDVRITRGIIKHEVRDGRFMTPQTSESLTPLTKEEVDEYYFSYPWWEERKRKHSGKYTMGFDYIARTQYDRIVAFHHWPAQSEFLTKAPKSSWFLCDPKATWLKSHRDLNLLMDLEAIREWIEPPGMGAMQIKTVRIKLEDADFRNRISEACIEGLEHEGQPIKELAHEIIDKLPELGLGPDAPDIEL